MVPRSDRHWPDLPAEAELSVIGLKAETRDDYDNNNNDTDDNNNNHPLPVAILAPRFWPQATLFSA